MIRRDLQNPLTPSRLNRRQFFGVTGNLDYALIQPSFHQVSSNATFAFAHEVPISETDEVFFVSPYSEAAPTWKAVNCKGKQHHGKCPCDWGK